MTVLADTHTIFPVNCVTRSTGRTLVFPDDPTSKVFFGIFGFMRAIAIRIPTRVGHPNPRNVIKAFAILRVFVTFDKFEELFFAIDRWQYHPLSFVPILFFLVSNFRHEDK